MQLSNALKLIIAKSAYESKRWLPLLVHAQDTANVMKYLLHSRYQGLADLCGMPFERLPEAWKPEQERMSGKDFKERFEFPMNEIQKAVLDTVDEVKSPGMFILEAPMGIGKTEVALSAAEILANKFEKTGVFFGLPTQVTANGKFERVS